MIKTSTSRYVVGSSRRTNPLVWCIAIICALLAVAVIIGGIVVFVGYIVVHPRVPFIKVMSASLDRFQYDQAGLLVTQITIVIRAENDNARAHARFQDTDFKLSFGGVDVAELVADPFDVPKNKSIDFSYVVESSPIPLDPEKMELISMSLRRNDVVFNLKGISRTRWRVGPLGSMKFVCHLDCQLHFNPQNGSSTNTNRCSSRAT